MTSKQTSPVLQDMIESSRLEDQLVFTYNVPWLSCDFVAFSLFGFINLRKLKLITTTHGSSKPGNHRLNKLTGHELHVWRNCIHKNEHIDQQGKHWLTWVTCKKFASSSSPEGNIPSTSKPAECHVDVKILDNNNASHCVENSNKASLKQISQILASHFALHLRVMTAHKKFHSSKCFYINPVMLHSICLFKSIKEFECWPFIFSVCRKSPSTLWSSRLQTWRATPPMACPTLPPLSSGSLTSMTTPLNSPQTQ